MEHLDPTHLLDAQLVARQLTTADYVKLLHPIAAIGKPTIMTAIAGKPMHSRIYRTYEAPWMAECCISTAAYITLNRFHGPRRDRRLAALNALYLDLDVDLAPRPSPRIRQLGRRRSPAMSSAAVCRPRPS